MGLNSFFEILLSTNMVLKRYCIDNKAIYNNLTKANTKNKLNQYLQKTISENILLTKEGMYKYIKHQLFKFKIDLHKINDLEKKKQYKKTSSKFLFGENTFIFPTSFQWKKHEEMYSFPKIHSKINTKTNFYKLNKKSHHRFVVEFINNKLSDFYFLSEENLDNHSLKEDINSFLAILN